jgi:hypothetical protein
MIKGCPFHWGQHYRRLMMRAALAAMVVASTHPAATSR